MKKIFYTLLSIAVCSSCVENTVDSQYEEPRKAPRTLRSLVTKSSSIVQEDSLTMVSKLQKDVDNLMMGRIVLKDSIFVLSLKREDAAFLGVSDEVYDKYLDYVDRLNEHQTENQ